MGEVSRIVCPVDLSQGARSTVAHATVLARLLSAELHLLYVRPAREKTPRRRPGDESGAGLGAMIAGGLWGPHGADPDVVVRLRLATVGGTAAKAVARYARPHDLIVVNAGYGAPRPWRQASSIVRDLTRSASCPVVVVPTGAVPPVRRRVTPIEVMCGVDFTSSSMAALRAAVALVEGRRGRLNVVHAVDLSNRVAYSGGEARRVMRDYEALAAAAKQRILRLEPLQTLPRSQVNAVVVSGQAPRALLRVASDLEADLIAMGAPRRGVLAELLVGPTSRTVLRRATCPVLLATGVEAACTRVGAQQVAEKGPPASRTAA